MQLLRIDWNVIFTIVNLIVLYLGLRKFLIGPVTKVMDQRKQLIEGQMADARHVNEQANELKAQYEDALKQAHEESAQIVEKARKSAQAEYESRMDAADAEAQKIIANAHKSIDLEREKTVQELQSQIAGLAMAATAKVLGDTDQAAQNHRMYEQLLAKTGGLKDPNSKDKRNGSFRAGRGERDCGRDEADFLTDWRIAARAGLSGGIRQGKTQAD